MRRFLIVSFAALYPSAAAFAGSLSITLNAASPAVNASKSYTVPDADVARIVAMARAQFPNNPDGSAATAAQSLSMWADALRNTIIGQVLDYERAKNVAPITAN